MLFNNISSLYKPKTLETGHFVYSGDFIYDSEAHSTGAQGHGVRKLQPPRLFGAGLLQSDRKTLYEGFY